MKEDFIYEYPALDLDTQIEELSLKEVMELTGKSSATIYRWIEKGAFPRQIHNSDNDVVWSKHEIDAWRVQRYQMRNRIHGIAQEIKHLSANAHTQTTIASSHGALA